MNGRIAIDRQIMEWEWWGDINVFRLWMVILMLANWQDKKWQGQVIKRGSFVTSYASLAEVSGLSVQQTRTAINKLKTTGEIEQIVTNKYQLIIVANYEKYQENFGNANNQSTINQQSNNNQSTINQQQLNKDNKGNKDNKDNKYKEGRFTPPTLSEVEAYISEKGYHIDASSFIDFYESKGWMVGKNRMKDWKAAVRTWEKRRTDGKRMGQVHDRTAEQDGRRMAGTTNGSRSGDQKSKVTFPRANFGYEEEE